MPSLNHFDYFILTETWLTSDIYDAELGMLDYNIYRSDRNSNNSVFKRGGGILIAINKKYFSRLIPSTNINCEHLSILVSIHNNQLLIHSCYIPPNSTLDQFHNYCTVIENLNINYPDSILIVAGDFNLPNISWINSSSHSIINGSKCSKADLLQESVVLLELFQFNLIKNHYHNILDLVFSNRSDLIVSKSNFPIVKEDIFHPTLQIIGPNFSNIRTLAKQNVDYNFSRGNYYAMNHFLCNYNWNSILLS